MPKRAGLTYADYAAIPDDGLRHELIEGRIVVTPSPDARHQTLVLRFARAFLDHLERAGGGKIFVAPFDVLLSENDVVQPDLVFIAERQAGILTKNNVQGSPALVIEILSEPRRDRIVKRDLYARFGVPEYWVVDPDADRVEVYRLSGERYARPSIFEPGEALEYAGLPGLRLDLATLLAP